MVVTVGFTDVELNLGMEVAESPPQLSLWALKSFAQNFGVQGSRRSACKEC